MNKFLGCGIGFFLCLAAQGQAQTKVLESPDGTIKLYYQEGNNLNKPLTYHLDYAKTPVVTEGTIQLQCANHSLKLRKTELCKKRDRWQTVYGDRRSIPENYNQQLIRFQVGDDSNLQLTI